MSTKAFPLTTTNTGHIHIATAYTPASHIHQPSSVYARWYWLPDLGPTAYLAWTTITLWLPDTDQPVAIDLTELARNLGTAPPRLTKALARLAAFHLADIDRTDTTTLRIKPLAPNLGNGQLARLTERCPTLAACHHLHTQAAS